MDKNKLPVSELLQNKSKFVELGIITIFLGFGISLTASSITIINGFKPMLGICLGGLICIVSVLYIFLKLLVKKEKKYLFKGFIVLNEIKNKIVNIEGYELSEISKYLDRAFLENKDLQYIWNNDPLKLQDELKTPEPRSMDVIREALEYFLLNKLSIHLNSYFHYPMKKNKNVALIQREHIPGVLLSNRFLELFSKPLKDRAAFSDIEQENEEQEWYILDVEGGTFQKFSLILPYRSKVNRTQKNEIEINNNKFKINLRVIFDGCNDLLPTEFLEYYLSIHGFENHLANVVYRVEFDINVKFKFTSFLSSYGWENYNWIDSFLNSINQSVSKESYFTRVNWSTIETLIKCLKTQNTL